MKHGLIYLSALVALTACTGASTDQDDGNDVVDPAAVANDQVVDPADITDALEGDYAPDGEHSSDFDQEISIAPAPEEDEPLEPGADPSAPQLHPTILGGKVGRPASMLSTASVAGTNARLCSATLVGKSTIMTAFHCVGVIDANGMLTGKLDPNFNKGRTLYMTSKKTYSLAAYPGVAYTIDAVIVDPSTKKIKGPVSPAYLRENDIRDVALVRLTTVVKGAKSASVASPSLAAGTLVTIGGYGREDGSPNPNLPAPRRRAKTLSINTIKSDWQTIVLTPGPGNGGPGGATYGDSGGPMYFGNDVVAVNSFTVHNDTTIYASAASRVNASWVRKAAK